jgi:hypothetical protein
MDWPLLELLAQDATREHPVRTHLLIEPVPGRTQQRNLRLVIASRLVRLACRLDPAAIEAAT